MWYNLPCHSHAENAFLFLSNSRLSVRVPHDCDKHEKQQVGGSLIRGTMKRCSKCREWKPEEQFSKNKSMRDGLANQCKVCMRENLARWQKENPDKVHEYNRKYRLSNPEKESARKVEYRQSNTQKVKDYSKKYYAENIEKCKERWNKWSNSNKERIQEKNKKWYQKNKAHIRAVSKIWRFLNGKNTEYNRKRKARARGAEGSYTNKEWQDLKERYNHTCLRCGRREPEIKLTPDHVLPLIKGGSNWISNIQPLCGSCNSSKREKHIDYR